MGWTAILTAFVPLLVAILGLWYSWWQGHRQRTLKTTEEMPEHIFRGFKQLSNELRGELDRQRQFAQTEQSRLHVEIRNMGAEVVKLRVAVRVMNGHIIQLHSILGDHAIPYPSFMLDVEALLQQ